MYILHGLNLFASQILGQGKNNTCRSNPWPNECLPRMKCALPTSVEHKVEAYCGTLSIPHRGSNLGLLSWQPSTLTTRLSETS